MENRNGNRLERLTYEAVIEKTGWGLYYEFVVGLCCCCTLAYAFAFMSIFVVLPFSACNMRLSNSHIMSDTGIFLFGTAIGNYMVGSIFDWFGRKNPVSLLLVFTFCGCFSAGFSAGSTMLELCIFCIGLSVTSARLATRIYVLESMPVKRRGPISSLLDACWTAGCLLSIALSLVYSSSLANYSADLRVASWRMFFALSGVLCMITSCLTALIFISPRFLLMKKRFVEAKETLRHMYAINCSQHADNWPVSPEIEIASLIQPQVFEEDRNPTTCWETILRVLSRIRILTMIMFTKKYVINTLILLFLKIILFPGIVLLTIMVTAVTLQFMDIPRSESRFISQNCTFSSMDFLFIQSTGSVENCWFEVNTTFIYMSTGFLGSVLLGQICLYYTINKIGRKIPLFVGLAFCSLFCGIFNLEMRFDFRIAIATAFFFFFGVCDTIVNLVLVESYPTRIRGTASGSTSFIPTVIVALMYCLPSMPIQCFIACVVYGVLLFVGIVLSTLIPDMTKKSMAE